MSEQEPTWTRDGDLLRTTYAGFVCRVVEKAFGTGPWWWEVNSGDLNRESGTVESLPVAQACALRTAEALAVLVRCRKGDPPESSGFPPQFSATDPSLPTPLGVFTPELDGTLAVSIWATNEDGDNSIIGFSELVVGSRDEFLRQVGEHLVHLGKYGWTSIHPEQRKELFGAPVTDPGEVATDEDDRG